MVNSPRPKIHALGGGFIYGICRTLASFDCRLQDRILKRFGINQQSLMWPSAALEEFNHLGIRFISVQDQVDTNSPMGKAMFTIIAAMAELESSLISERVKAGMKAAQARGKRIGRPATSARLVRQIEELAETTDLGSVQYACNFFHTRSEWIAEFQQKYL